MGRARTNTRWEKRMRNGRRNGVSGGWLENEHREGEEELEIVFKKSGCL